MVKDLFHACKSYLIHKPLFQITTMSTKRSLYGTVSRLLGSPRSSVPPGQQLNTSKKDGSATLLGADATPFHKELKDVPGPWPSLPFIGTGWQYFPGSEYAIEIACFAIRHRRTIFLVGLVLPAFHFESQSRGTDRVNASLRVVFLFLHH